MKTKTHGFSYALTMLYTLAGVLFLYFLVRGGSYYLTPLTARPRHVDYAIFRPAGTWGLGFGIAGTAMMLSLLLYSLRKRTRVFGKVFRLKVWLDVHIFLGIMGPLFVLLHTSFKFDGLVAVSFWAMVAVACSGVFGRYLYLQIPRNIRGDELSIQELEEQDADLSRELGEQFGLNARQIGHMMDLLYEAEPPHPGISRIILGDLRRRWSLARARKVILDRFPISHQKARDLVNTAMRKSTLQLRIARLATIQKVFHYWHVIHRPFAVIMYAIMFIHIAVALLFGIAWRG